MEKEKIIAIKKDNLDRIIEFKTNTNKIYNYEMAKEAINNGLIDNAIVLKGNDTLLHIMEKQGNNLTKFEKMEEF
jgi:hypothetical protein